MVPYFTFGPWQVGTVRIYVFGVTAAAALVTWLALILSRAGRFALEPRRALRLLECILACGLAGALGLGLTQHPAAYSSFGGGFGALLGAVLYFRIVPTKLLWSYLDLLAYAFPFGWVWVRLGCALIHEHPGRLTGSWLAVQYPGGARYDLGLLEMMLSLLVAAAFLILGRHPRAAPGFYIRWIVICGPLRLALDMLRDQPDDRTAAIALTVVGVWVYHRTGRLAT